MELWDFVKSVNESKKDLFKEDPILAEKTYNPFIINRAFSFFRDTVLHANQLNVYHDIPKKVQFSFLLNSISKRRRWNQWHKKSPKSADLELVMSYYGYNEQKALEALKILTKQQIKSIRDGLNKGGK